MSGNVTDFSCSETEFGIVVVDSAAIRDAPTIHFSIDHSAQNREWIRARVWSRVGHITSAHTDVVRDCCSSVVNIEQFVVEIADIWIGYLCRQIISLITLWRTC